jgi:hypothetical protein
MSRSSSLNLIPESSVVKASKCQSCVQSNQPRKTHKVAEERHLVPLELIHSDICDINCVLTEGGQRYFIAIIDDASKYCYTYLLKTKYRALICFKIYTTEAENQLEKKIKWFRSD